MAKQQYYTLNKQEIGDFLSASAKQPYKMKGHSWIPLKGVGKNYCSGCGLVALNNKITQWCIKKGCNFSDSPYYKPFDNDLLKIVDQLEDVVLDVTVERGCRPDRKNKIDDLFRKLRESFN